MYRYGGPVGGAAGGRVFGREKAPALFGAGAWVGGLIPLRDVTPLGLARLGGFLLVCPVCPTGVTFGAGQCGLLFGRLALEVCCAAEWWWPGLEVG